MLSVTQATCSAAVEAVPQCLASKAIFGYLNKLTFSLDRGGGRGDISLGMMRRGFKTQGRSAAMDCERKFDDAIS